MNIYPNKPNDDRSLSFGQLQVILSEIHNYHTVIYGRHIKYVTPKIDMRDCAVFRLELKCVAAQEDVIFDYRDSNEPMFKRISDWLDEGKGKGLCDQ